MPSLDFLRTTLWELIFFDAPHAHQLQEDIQNFELAILHNSFDIAFSNL